MPNEKILVYTDTSGKIPSQFINSSSSSNELKNIRFYSPTVFSAVQVQEGDFNFRSTGGAVYELDSSGAFYNAAANNSTVEYLTSTSPLTTTSNSSSFIVKCRTANTLNAGVIYWVGLFNGIGASNTNNAGRDHIAFRFQVGTDTGWRPSVYNGTTQTLGTNIGTVTANTVYYLKVRFDSVTQKAFFSVAGINKVFGVEVEVSTNIPISARQLYISQTTGKNTSVSPSDTLKYGFFSFETDV